MMKKKRKYNPLTHQNRKDLIWLTNKLRKGAVVFSYRNKTSMVVVGTLNERLIPPKYRRRQEQFHLFQNGFRTFFNLSKTRWDFIDVRTLANIRVSA